jgi:hypothetical protein
MLHNVSLTAMISPQTYNLQSGPCHREFLPTFLSIYYLNNLSRILRPKYPPSFDHPNNIRRIIQGINILLCNIPRLLLASSFLGENLFLTTLLSKCLSQHTKDIKHSSNLILTNNFRGSNFDLFLFNLTRVSNNLFVMFIKTYSVSSAVVKNIWYCRLWWAGIAYRYSDSLWARPAFLKLFFKWGPLLLVRMFYGPPYSCPLRKQII